VDFGIDKRLVISLMVGRQENVSIRVGENVAVASCCNYGMTIVTSQQFALKDPGTGSLRESVKRNKMMAMNGIIPLPYNRGWFVVQKCSTAEPGFAVPLSSCALTFCTKIVPGGRKACIHMRKSKIVFCCLSKGARPPWHKGPPVPPLLTAIIHLQSSLNRRICPESGFQAFFSILYFHVSIVGHSSEHFWLFVRVRM
jgi:hypothetical protein